MGLAVMLASKLVLFLIIYNRSSGEDTATFIMIHHQLISCLAAWSFGRLVVWSFGCFRPGSDADAQKAVVDFQSSCAAAEPLGLLIN